MSDFRASKHKTVESVADGTRMRRGSQGGKRSEKPLEELFSRDELYYYGTAAVIYIILGVLFQATVLNCTAGPLFIVLWMWWVPPLVGKLKERRS